MNQRTQALAVDYQPGDKVIWTYNVGNESLVGGWAIERILAVVKVVCRTIVLIEYDNHSPHVGQKFVKKMQLELYDGAKDYLIS